LQFSLDDDFAIDEKKELESIHAENSNDDSWRFRKRKKWIKMKIEVQFLGKPIFEA
jgi:hypothetical protein